MTTMMMMVVVVVVVMRTLWRSIQRAENLLPQQELALAPVALIRLVRDAVLMTGLLAQ